MDMQALLTASWWHDYLDVAQVISGFATAIAAAIGAISLIAIFLQIRHGRDQARETIAMDAHKEYMKLCLDNPQLSSSPMALGYLNRESFDGILSNTTDPKAEEVLWFISFLLFNVEQILGITHGKKSDAWTITMRAQLGYHQAILREIWGSFQPHYSEGVDVLVREVLSKQIGSDGMLID